MSHDRRVKAAPLTSSASPLLPAVALVSLFFFIVLASSLVAAGPTNPWDIQIAKAARALRTPALDVALFIATYLCSWQVIVVGLAAAMTYLLFIGPRRAAIALLVSVLGDDLVVSILKNTFDRARPDQLQALLPAIGPSFPSGHTFAAVAFYGVLALIVTRMVPSRAARRIVRAITALFIIAVGISRVYLGAHWPSDVLGSWTLGTAWLAAIGIGLDLGGRRFPPDRQPVFQNWLLALTLFVVWLGFVVAVGFLQPSLRQAASIAELSIKDLGGGQSCWSLPTTWPSCVVRALPPRAT